MIDTISIRLPLTPGNYKNDEYFHPLPLSSLWHSSGLHLTIRFNPGKTLAKRTSYTPTYYGERFITKGATQYCLRVEVSLPKLLYGNNVEELPPGEETLGKIITKLLESLNRDLGIGYTRGEILLGEITKLHVGKNFMFNDPGAPLFIIEAINKGRADRVYDDNKIQYENLGSSFRIHSNTKDTIFYDKKMDIAKSLRSPKRAIDGEITNGARNENTSIGLFLADKRLSTLRLEVRLNNKRHIRKAFPSLCNDLTFRNVFLNAPIISYLADEWQKSTDGISMVQLGKDDVCSMFESIAANKSLNYSMRDSLAIATVMYIIEKHGLNYLRSIIEKYYDRDNWYRLKRKLVGFKGNRLSYFMKVEEELCKYRPVRLRDAGSKSCR